MAEMKTEETTSEKKSLNFIEQIVENDLQEGKNDGRVQTRFPPEPNGYLHIGHAKAICLDFGIAAAHGGVCNLRFDDTNPTKEDVEYVEAIKEDIRWLGYQWGHEYYASDYFQQLWDFAIRLIKEGKAYVDEQTSEQIAAQKGTPTQPGTESPYRNRPIEESLELFQKMNTGEIEEGAMVLRAKIDMANPNMHFRDPIIYRIVKHPHHRTGTKWKAYPMYDFAHGQSDFFEGVTHSLCTLEFVVHRPLYDLFIDWLKEGNDLNDHRPRQYEFNKLNLSYTLMSKRNLLTLVKEGRPSAASAAAVIRPNPSTSSSTRSATPRMTPSTSLPCWRAPCAKTSTNAPPASPPCSTPSASSSPTIPREDRWRNWKPSTTPNAPKKARTSSSSAASCGWSATTSWKWRPRNTSA